MLIVAWIVAGEATRHTRQLSHEKPFCASVKMVYVQTIVDFLMNIDTK